ncbi:MAG: acetoacetate--CoA ligase [Alphaproteobacteria bacterium]|nr:acetoacetate--CoA ligase [Alphaproteobacteria bacterium]
MSDKPLWQPTAERAGRTQVAAFMRAAGMAAGHRFAIYDELWQWSIERPDAFWVAVWTFCRVIGERGRTVIAHGDKMPGARFFPEGKINFAENLLRRRDDGVAIFFQGEDKIRRSLTFGELYALVSLTAQALKGLGVGPGDRVGAFMPNLPETIIAALATASLGAVWSSCSPDFGVNGVLDRFGQITPKVLFAADGYHYAGKSHDCLDRVRGIAERLPGLERIIITPYVAARPNLGGLPKAVLYEDFVKPFHAADIPFHRQAFNAPLYILYSSGTTGLPKCIVHGQGGTLLKHLEEQQLQVDLRRDERFFYFTTCGWMMWNWLVSGLASGATLVLYDGSPFHPGPHVLWDMADRVGVNVFGTSAKYIDALAKSDYRPARRNDLKRLRAILSTGSPLAPQGFDFVYKSVKQDVHLASMSGGTDLIGCFVAGDPTSPVWRGEIQKRVLGMAVDVFDENGLPLRGGQGELVCANPFPSMPLGFWNDPGDAKYRAAYFDRFRDTWCHGDWVELTVHGGMIIHGRSDATLNPGGVRIGTAEIYRQVEKLDEVVESLVIGQDWDNDARVVLFLRLKEGLTLDKALIDKIKKQIRDNTTPRHVPAKVIQVADIPRTISGKIVELAVRNVVHGRPVKNRDALANPAALELFANLPELKS